jgi:hypothetical protein
LKTGPFISKSRFLAGLQCHKLFWHRYHRPKDFPEVDTSTQLSFDQGHEIGELAKSLYPDGIEVQRDHRRLPDIVSDTQAAIARRKPIYEAGFIVGNLMAYADILNPVGKTQWDLIEVKSATSVKDVNLWDVAFQSHVIEAGGIKLRNHYVLHLNSDYVKKGPVDAKKLFAATKVTSEITLLKNQVPSRIKELCSVHALAKSPEVDIGPHCSDPYECPLVDKCWKHVGGDSVLNLVRSRKSYEWYRDGHRSLVNLPKFIYETLNEKQKIQCDATHCGRPHVNQQAIADFLKNISYPAYYLDFETFQTAIPLYDGCKPWQQVPFQYSLHIFRQAEDKGVHKMFLAEGRGDPRKDFLEGLIDQLGETGSILTYNAAFEKSRLKECVEVFPEHRKWLKRILSRIVDLYDPFRAFHFYHPSQNGSASIKAVLPALVGGDGYNDLEIGNGSLASSEFLRITFGDASQQDRKRTRKALEAYCCRDTEAMVLVHEKLHKIALGYL